MPKSSSKKFSGGRGRGLTNRCDRTGRSGPLTGLMPAFCSISTGAFARARPSATLAPMLERVLSGGPTEADQAAHPRGPSEGGDVLQELLFRKRPERRGPHVAGGPGGE